MSSTSTEIPVDIIDNQRKATLSSLAIELGEVDEQISSHITTTTVNNITPLNTEPLTQTPSLIPETPTINNKQSTLILEPIPSTTITITTDNISSEKSTTKLIEKIDTIPFPDSIYQYLYILKGRKSSSACLDRIISLVVLLSQIGGYLAIALYTMQNGVNNIDNKVNNNYVNKTPTPTTGFENSYYKYYIGYVSQTSKPTVFTLLYVAYIIMMFLFPDICNSFYLLFTQKCCVCRSLWNRFATWLIFCTSLLAVGCVIISISFQFGELSLFNMLSTGIGVIFISDIDDKILPVFKKNKGFWKRILFVTFFCGFTALTTILISYFQHLTH